MIFFVKKHLLPATVALILFMVALPIVEKVFNWYFKSFPAIEWVSGKALTPTVEPGGELRIVYTAVVNKSCPADIRSFIIGPDGTVPVRMPIVSGGYTKPSDDVREIKVSIKIPEHSDPGLSDFITGPYIYRTMITRYCPDGVEQDTEVPDVKFFMEVK